MTIFFNRINLTASVLAYISFIWWQSSNFNPETVFALTSHINIYLFYLIGACLEAAHLFEFGILYFLLVLLFLTFGPLSKKKEVIALILSILYGVIDEIHQHFVPYRTASMNDFVKDAIGVAVVWWFVHNSYYDKKFVRLRSILKSVENSRNKL